MAGGTIDHVFNVASVAVILNDVPRQDQFARAVLQVCQLTPVGAITGGLFIKPNAESDAKRT